jgi:hypothetical protein
MKLSELFPIHEFATLFLQIYDLLAFVKFLFFFSLVLLLVYDNNFFLFTVFHAAQITIALL